MQEFHKGKSCLNQTYVFDSVVRNRFNENKDTFVSLIAFKKYFDYIDRDLLL